MYKCIAVLIPCYNETFIRPNATKNILIAQSILFLCLFCAGITGSSLGFIKKAVDIVSMDEKKLIGQYRQIRSDEWGVGTLLAIGQYNSEPRFPALNERLGIDGKELAIAHDLSVPVAQLSAIAKPATWGFFFSDLRRALSWYWFFPLFLGINGVWFLLNTIWKRQSGANFLLTLGLAFAPICVAWSFWPFYIIGFAALTTALFLSCILSDSPLKSLFLAGLLGWSGASLALTLYLPRIIPLVTLMAFCAVAFLSHHRLWKECVRRLPYLFVAFAVLSGILFSWYADNTDAIVSMLNSDYPGQRRILGGAFHLWDLFRGWLAPVTLYYSTFHYSNPCELSSYFSFLPIIAGFLLYAARLRRVTWIVTSVAVFIGMGLFYQYIGFPHLLGALSFWDRSHPPRVDSSIAVGQVLLFAWMYAMRDSVKIGLRIGAALAFIYAVFVSGILLLHSPAVFVDILEPDILFMSLLFFSVMILSWMLLCQRKAFIIGFTLVTLCSTFFWHPVCVAPSYFKDKLPPIWKIKNLNHRFGGKIMFATNNSWYATAAFAAGRDVLNGVHHYVDQSIYQRFYDNSSEQGLRRYHHMAIHITENRKKFDVRIPQADVIQINLDGEFYDFKNVEADFLAAFKNWTNLRKNSTLRYLCTSGRLAYYQILH